jgi:hypothetical protein
MPDEINIRDYTKDLLEAERRYYEAEITAIRRAVDKYSDTNDEWKNLHNGLQRKLDDQIKNSVPWRALWAVVVFLAMFVLGLLSYFKK